MDSSENKAVPSGVKIEPISKTPLARDSQFIDGLLKGAMHMHAPKIRGKMSRQATRDLLFAAVSEQLSAMLKRQTLPLSPRFQVRMTGNVASIEFNQEDIWTIQAWLENKQANPLHFEDEDGGQAT